MLVNKEYKDSGISWIGNIPAKWGIDKIGSVYIERRTIVSDEEYEPLSVTKTGIVLQLDNAAKSDAHDNRKLVVAGDFVINSRSDRKGSSGISNLDGSVSLINTVLEPRANMNNKYYNFVFKTDMFCDEFYKWGHGIVADLWTTRWTDMKNIYVPRPDLSEQKAIADYLDKECARIDDIVEKQRNIIEKLKEYKKSVITEAVTRGLNPTAPMKDSGIEWIGKIPEHWEAGKVFYYLDSIGSGTTPTGDDYYAEQGINWLNTSDLTDGYITEIPKKITPQAIQDFSALKIHKADSLVIAMYGATIGKLGIITEDTTTNQACCVMTPTKDLYNKFLFYCLYAGKDYMLYLSFGSGQPNINQNILRHFIIPHVPIEEQQAIADYLDQKCAEIDSVIEKREKMIDLLIEYKKSIIYECVTGKKEVA